MKIFPKDSQTTSSVDSSKKASAKGITRKKPELPVRKELSADAIKQKIADNEAKSKSVDKVEINSKKLGDSFLNEEAVKKAPIMVKEEVIAEKIKMVEEGKSPNTKDFIIKSDVQLNDPQDTNTQEKLKAVLARGAFNFNPKEREALDKILQSS